jgi:hypothetical protein
MEVADTVLSGGGQKVKRTPPGKATIAGTLDGGASKTDRTITSEALPRDLSPESITPDRV